MAPAQFQGRPTTHDEGQTENQACRTPRNLPPVLGVAPGMGTSRSRFRRLMVLGFGLSMLVTACGESGSSGGSGSATGSGPASPGPGPGAPTTPSPTPTPPAPGAQITVSGVLIEGLRPTCRVLQTDKRRYALVGPGTLALKEGDHVTVTGAERPDLRNPCGLTLVVSTII